MRHIGVGGWHCTNQARQNILRVLDSGRLSYGPYSKELEYRFAAMHGNQFGILSSSGTDSLQIALQAMKEIHGWQDGDEVIVPSVTFVATVNVVLHNNLKPVLVDVEKNYYGIDPALIEKAITRRTRAIIPAHLFGMPCNMLCVCGLAGRYDLRVLVDSCETVCAEHRDKPIGQWGDISVFSFYVAHLLTTGVGGIATTDNVEYATAMRSLANHGRDSISYFSIDDDDDLEVGRLREVVEKRFHFERIGHSSRLTELEAAIGVAHLDTIESEVTKRRLNALHLYTGLMPLLDKLQLPKTRPHTSSSYMMFPIVLIEGSKWDLVNYLEERGIETREMLRLTDQPCYKGLWDLDDYPVAKWLNERGFYIGCHPGLSTDDLDYIIDAHRDYFNGTE